MTELSFTHVDGQLFLNGHPLEETTAEEQAALARALEAGFPPTMDQTATVAEAIRVLDIRWPMPAAPARRIDPTARDWFGEAVAAARRLGHDATQLSVADAMDPGTTPDSLRHGLARQDRTWDEVLEEADRT